MQRLQCTRQWPGRQDQHPGPHVLQGTDPPAAGRALSRRILLQRTGLAAVALTVPLPTTAAPITEPSYLQQGLAEARRAARSWRRRLGITGWARSQDVVALVRAQNGALCIQWDVQPNRLPRYDCARVAAPCTFALITTPAPLKSSEEQFLVGASLVAEATAWHLLCRSAHLEIEPGMAPDVERAVGETYLRLFADDRRITREFLEQFADLGGELAGGAP